ncbi:MAG: molecular chaperone TorD family protein [Acidobacteria bacterium]|nr:molecular chaperone TorD family protein [Acidobacteriota bacterium]
MSVPLEAPARQLLAEAAEWRLIGMLLECPSGSWRGRVEELEGEVEDAELRQAARLALEQASEGLYHSTFGPGGPAPPREATHRDTLQLGYLLSELNAYYASFGYRPESVSFEPPDHIAVESGFVAYLKFKEAFAAACGDAEARETTAQACREFVTEHLASTAAPLKEMLAASGVPYLELTGRAMARRAGPAKQRFLVLGASSMEGDDSSEFGCGVEDQSS